jgi:hypothetical protein
MGGEARLPRLGGKPVDRSLLQHGIDPRSDKEIKKRAHMVLPVQAHGGELAHFMLYG